MHFTLNGVRSLRAALVATAMLAACPAAFGQSAYIMQVNPRSPGFTSTNTVAPTQTIPVFQYTPSQTAFIPTPETAMPARNGNFAQTIQIGSFNRVLQSQSGGNNFSNVGVIGGKKNNVGVWQGGGDVSNLNLVNTQGMTVDVLQPRGAAPVNMLIVRAPNGALVIKR